MAEKVFTPLRLAIVKAGRTQRALADEIGISESMLSNFVAGRRHPDERTRQRIADALGLPAEVLFPSQDANNPRAAA